MNHTRHRTAAAIAALALTLLATLLGLAGATPAPAGAQAAPPLPAAATRWAQISAGRSHTCAVTDAGAAWCWGQGSNGKLGNGQEDSSFVPTPVTTPTGVTWASITAGDEHTCALATDGAAWCWGLDRFGQLGNGSVDGEGDTSPTPVRVAGTAVFTQINAGWETCGVATDGRAWCWGYSGLGALGAGPTVTTNQPAPVLVDLPGATFASIDVGNSTVCAVTTAGAGYCWGNDRTGQRGDGPGDETQDAYRPVPLATPAGETAPVTWARIDVGNQHACGTTTAGAGYCWGYNVHGQTGDGESSEPRTIPQPVPNPAGATLTWSKVDGGFHASCGLTTTGAVLCVGGNNTGELGQGDAVSDPGSSPQSPPEPIATDDVATWSDLDMGSGAYGCGISAAGRAWCWGVARDGQLGIGLDGASTIVVTKPTAVVTAAAVPTTVGLTATPTTAGDGDDIVFTATATGDDTDGSFDLAIAVDSPSGPVRTEQADSQGGTATWTIDDLGVGTYTASATYRDGGGRIVATSGSVAIRVLTPAEEAVASAYAAVLGREPDPAGLAFWVEQLKTKTPAAVADALAKSREGRARLVTLTYESVLGYRPGTASRDYWVGELLAGRTTPERLVAELYGTITANPVDALYRIHLGRTPSSADRAYWAPKVDTAAERKQSSLGTGRTPEALKVLVRRATTAACGEGAAVPTGAALTAATDHARATAGDIVRVTARLAATHCPTT